MSSPQYLEAQQLAGLGYRVFPITPDEKAPPLVTDWPNVATDDADQIDAWWAQWPTANVGLATAGLIVLDIDPLADGKPNPWPNDAERALELGAAPGARTPRGGTHRIFRQPAGRTWHNTTNAALHVDTRADGGYILVAPSSVKGKAYHWLDGSPLDCEPAKLSEPPQWMLDELYGQRGGNLESVRSDTSAPGNPIPDGQRNATLTRHAGALRRRGNTESEIASLLLTMNRERCNPPMPDDEVKKIAWSVARYEPDQLATAIAENWAGEVLGDVPAPDGPSDPGPTPEHLLDVPGFMHDVIEFSLATAPYPNRVLSFAGALTLQGFLASRKVRDPMGNRTNLYVAALANSGSGKDHPRKINRRIAMAAGLGDCIGDSLVSGEGLEDLLAVHPATLLQLDELDGYFRAMKIAAHKEPRYQRLLQSLLTIYTSADSSITTRPKARTNGAKPESTEIHSPGLTIFGTCVPAEFYDSLSPAMLTNGTFARFLLMEASRRGKGQRFAVSDVPASIIATATWWAKVFEKHPHFAGKNMAAIDPDPIVVPFKPAAEAMLMAFREESDNAHDEAEIRGDGPAMTVYTRSPQNALRLALNYSCSADHLNLQITEDAARWAIDFVRHQNKRMLFMAATHVASSGFEEKSNKLLGVLRAWNSSHQDEPMPTHQLNRRLRSWTPRERDEVVKALVEQGEIEQIVSDRVGAGRPGIGWRLKYGQNMNSCLALAL